MPRCRMRDQRADRRHQGEKRRGHGWDEKLTGHHWTTHSVIVIVLFLGWDGLLALREGRSRNQYDCQVSIATVVSGVAIAGLIIIGFYLFAD